MPITQDRLVNLIEITELALERHEALQALLGGTEATIVEISGALANGNEQRLRAALAEAKRQLMLVYNTMNENKIPPALYKRLGAEQAHFKLRSKRNAHARDYMRAVRSGPRPSRLRLTPEKVAETDAALRQRFAELDSVSEGEAPASGKAPTGGDAI